MPARWLTRHMTEKHGAVASVAAPAKKIALRVQSAVPADSGRPRCQHCGKSFAKVSGLASHLHFLHPDQSGSKRKSTEKPALAANSRTPTAKSSAGEQAKAKTAKCEHCGQTFTTVNRLATHIKYRHSQAQDGRVLPTPTLSAPIPAATSLLALPTSVDQHLKTALEELTRRHQEVDDQLSRMESLKSEKEAISKQIAAVNAALQAF
jgi:ribosomal protein L37AE/L43A